jgi:hypothetical protein
MANFVRIDDFHYIGLSTDTKPSSCQVGAEALEHDTKMRYITPDGGANWTVLVRLDTPEETGGNLFIN